jgi:hypothetical protein
VRVWGVWGLIGMSLSVSSFVITIMPGISRFSALLWIE